MKRKNTDSMREVKAKPRRCVNLKVKSQAEQINNIRTILKELNHVKNKGNIELFDGKATNKEWTTMMMV